MKKKFLKDQFFLRTAFDINLLLDILFLNVFGIIMIYSASYYYAESAYGYPSTYFFFNQIEYVIAGFILMFMIAFIRPSFYKKLWIPALFIAGIFMIAVRIPGLAHASHGAYRWISIGGRLLQVAEPIKICLIVSLSGFLTKCDIKNPRVRICVIFIALIFILGLWMLTSNMSTAIIVGLIIFFMMMINDENEKPYIIVLIAGVVMIAIGILIIKYLLPYVEGENFRITRIRSWLYIDDPQYVDNSTGYQAKQALYAIASGGFFGKGLGQSIIKFSLPEPHNDYILAIIFEELGIFGVLLLTYLFTYLLYRIFTVYKDSHDKFSRYVVLGIFIHFAAQVIMNYAVTLGMLPTMGVTLPFISAGGSAAFFSLAELGIIIAVQRQNIEEKMYRDAKKELEERDPYLRTINSEARYRKKKHYRTVK